MEELITYAQASRLLNLKPGTLYALVAQNRIPHIRLGGRLVLLTFTSDDPEAFTLAVAHPEAVASR